MSGGFEKGGKMMKKKLLILTVFMILLALISVNVNAESIPLNSLKEDELRELESQIQSKLQLMELENANEYKLLQDYQEYERNPAKHIDERVSFSGLVLQVTETEDRAASYRIAVDGDGDQVIAVFYQRPDGTGRILEDDSVTVYGSMDDLYTYTSTTNLSVSVPHCTGDLVIRKITNEKVLQLEKDGLTETENKIEERLKKLEKKDKSGNITITKKNYEEYARNGELHIGESITFDGKVLQTLENDELNMIRVGVGGSGLQVIYVIAPAGLNEYRILEDDQITVTAECTGLYTYSSTLSGNITIPSCLANGIKLKGYQVPKNVSKDKKGNIKLTKKLFEDYSRRPSAHENEKITFSAKVVQVIDGSETSSYRLALESDSNLIIYTTIANADRGTRILEDDKITVEGTFDGLMSYESTMGVVITVPRCSATSMTLQGEKAKNRPSKNKDGFYSVTKKNYENFARDEATYLNEKLTFTAKVVQVSEDTDETILRLAVDKSSDSIFLAVLANENRQMRILDDDLVTVTGTSTGLFSYQSTMGGKITIPSCTIDTYTITNYKQKEIGEADKNGYYQITKNNYEEYARNPDPYIGKQIKFKAKVIQVVESIYGPNIYRVAVGSDNNCIFYLEYDLPEDSSRILEKDIINLTGTFDGIYRYTTTRGATVSVPAMTVTKLTKKK